VRWTTLPQAAAACREVIKCGCKKKCTGRCNCAKASLPCTELCVCVVAVKTAMRKTSCESAYFRFLGIPTLCTFLTLSFSFQRGNLENCYVATAIGNFCYTLIVFIRFSVLFTACSPYITLYEQLYYYRSSYQHFS